MVQTSPCGFSFKKVQAVQLQLPPELICVDELKFFVVELVISTCVLFWMRSIIFILVALPPVFETILDADFSFFVGVTKLLFGVTVLDMVAYNRRFVELFFG